MRAARALLLVAGLLIVLGAPTPWVSCSSEPCGGGLQHIWIRSGIDVGWGIATAILGAVILVAAVADLRRASLREIARLAGFATLVIAGGFALRVWVVPEFPSYGPQIGFIATALGGLIAAVGDPVLRRRSTGP